MAFPVHSADQAPFALPPSLTVLHLRLTLRLLTAGHLPAFKGALLRGVFGYALQRIACPSICHEAVARCTAQVLCAFRGFFEAERPAGVLAPKGQDSAPRSYVIVPPADLRTQYAAGESLEFQMLLIGSGSASLLTVLRGWEAVQDFGLGTDALRVRLERIEALHPWQPVGVPIYQDGRIINQLSLPEYQPPAVQAYAAALPPDLCLHLTSPLRIKYQAHILRHFDLAALLSAAGARIDSLAREYGAGPWAYRYGQLVAQAPQIKVEPRGLRWVDWHRTSTRGAAPEKMALGGVVGDVVLRGVPPDARAVLAFGSLIHVGKSCVFGHGGSTLTPLR